MWSNSQSVAMLNSVLCFRCSIRTMHNMHASLWMYPTCILRVPLFPLKHSITWITCWCKWSHPFQRRCNGLRDSINIDAVVLQTFMHVQIGLEVVWFYRGKRLHWTQQNTVRYLLNHSLRRILSKRIVREEDASSVASLISMTDRNNSTRRAWDGHGKYAPV